MRLMDAREGDHGDDVLWTQKVLGIAPATGVFDARTTQRLKGFQVAHGLYPTGRLTPETLAALESAT